MDYTTAKELIEHLKNLDGPINAATLVTEHISDVDERRKIRKSLARITSMVYIELMVPIGKKYPELLPDQQEEQE